MDGSEVSTRDRDTIERELRLLVSVRSAYRQRGGALPPVSQMDALLDELLALGPPNAPKPYFIEQGWLSGDPNPGRSPSNISACRACKRAPISSCNFTRA